MALLNLTAYKPSAGGLTSAAPISSAFTAIEGAFNPITWDVVVEKSSDQTVTNNGTPQADSQLLFALNSGEVWEWEIALVYSGNNTTGNYLYNASFPTSSGWWNHLAFRDTAGTNFDLLSAARFISATVLYPGTSFPIGTHAADTPMTAFFKGMIRGEASGTFNYTFCNFTAAAGRTSTTRAGSTLRARKLV